MDQAELDVIELVLREAETISGVSGRLWSACPPMSELLNFTRSLFWFLKLSVGPSVFQDTIQLHDRSESECALKIV